MNGHFKQHEWNSLEFLQGNIDLAHRTRPGATTGYGQSITLKWKAQWLDVASLVITTSRRGLASIANETSVQNWCHTGRERGNERNKLAGEWWTFNMLLWMTWHNKQRFECQLAQKEVLPNKRTWPGRLLWVASVTMNKSTVVPQKVSQMVRIQTCLLYPNVVLKTKMLHEMEFRLG